MSFLKNGTMISGGGIGSGSSSTSTASYNFPSGSFKHPKQPNANMPTDQKAKLLAMHRDGKANAGIYVAVVLVVYFILITMLLCRYGKRRRTPEASSGLDTTAERGRLQVLSFHIGKIATCGGGGGEVAGSCCGCCCGNFCNLLCFGRCQGVDTAPAKRIANHHSTLQNENSEISKVGVGVGLMKNNICVDDSSSHQTNLKDKEDVKKSLMDKGDNGKRGKAVKEVSQVEYQPNEDSEESLEDD